MRSERHCYCLQPVLMIMAVVGQIIAAPARGAEHKRPNFLFVYTDDQRWDAMGVVQKEQGERGRYPWFETPNMDRLAREGVRFRNAFVTLSLCAPSRAAFLTGRYNHLNGVANNRTSFPENNVTHASLLRAAGYVTAYIGKWHMDSQRGQRPGFDYSASFVGQGRYFDCPFEINGKPTPTKGWVDDVSTDYAIAFMKEVAAATDRPFSIVVGFKACHGPFIPPERAKDRFAGAQILPAPNLKAQAIYRDPNDPRGGSSQNDRTRVDLNYFRCISAADDDLGRLLQALADLGLADDTVVVFSSDNGYYDGEHGLSDKRSAYEESLRIPLLVRYPRLVRTGQARDEMVLNIDLAPTLLELAGVKIPAEMQGRSWMPLLAGKVTEWRKAFLAEYFLENNHLDTPTMLALRTETAKLIRYPGHDDWTELFDLASDPYETRNLARDTAHADQLAEMKAELNRQIKATAYTVPSYADKPEHAVQPRSQNEKPISSRSGQASD